MNRKLKALGLALVAALALTAVVVSAASAQFTSNKEHTVIEGAQKLGTNDVFTAGEGFGGITCENATFKGTAVDGNEPDQTITPTYSNCKDSFGRTVDIDNGELNEKGEVVNKLTYTFTPVKTTRKTDGTLVATDGGEVHVSGKMTLTVTSGGSVVCTVAIKVGQTNNGISYTNVTHKTVEVGEQKETLENDVEVTSHSTNVISTTSGGFFNCGISNGEHKNGTYDGTAVVKGVDTTGAAAIISVDDEVVTVHP